MAKVTCSACGALDFEEDEGQCYSCGKSDVKRLFLVGPSGKRLEVGRLGMDCGADLIGQVHPDEAAFAAAHQFSIRNEEDSWKLVPVPSTPNATVHNDVPIEEPTVLNSGDFIGVGGRASGARKCMISIVMG
jgi:hypothetical protein